MWATGRGPAPFLWVAVVPSSRRLQLPAPSAQGCRRPWFLQCLPRQWCLLRFLPVRIRRLSGHPFTSIRNRSLGTARLRQVGVLFPFRFIAGEAKILLPPILAGWGSAPPLRLPTCIQNGSALDGLQNRLAPLGDVIRDGVEAGGREDRGGLWINEV